MNYGTGVRYQKSRQRPSAPLLCDARIQAPYDLWLWVPLTLTKEEAIQFLTKYVFLGKLDYEGVVAQAPPSMQAGAHRFTVKVYYLPREQVLEFLQVLQDRSFYYFY